MSRNERCDGCPGAGGACSARPLQQHPRAAEEARRHAGCSSHNACPDGRHLPPAPSSIRQHQHRTKPHRQRPAKTAAHRGRAARRPCPPSLRQSPSSPHPSSWTGPPPPAPASAHGSRLEGVTAAQADAGWMGGSEGRVRLARRVRPRTGCSDAGRRRLRAAVCIVPLMTSSTQQASSTSGRRVASASAAGGRRRRRSRPPPPLLKRRLCPHPVAAGGWLIPSRPLALLSRLPAAPGPHLSSSC